MFNGSSNISSENKIQNASKQKGTIFNLGKILGLKAEKRDEMCYEIEDSSTIYHCKENKYGNTKYMLESKAAELVYKLACVETIEERKDILGISHQKLLNSQKGTCGLIYYILYYDSINNLLLTLRIDERGEFGYSYGIAGVWEKYIRAIRIGKDKFKIVLNEGDFENYIKINSSTLINNSLTKEFAEECGGIKFKVSRDFSPLLEDMFDSAHEEKPEVKKEEKEKHEEKKEGIPSEGPTEFKLEDIGLGNGTYKIEKNKKVYYVEEDEIEDALANLILELQGKSKELLDEERKDIKKYKGILEKYKEKLLFAKKVAINGTTAWRYGILDYDEGKWYTYMIDLWSDKEGKWLPRVYGRVEGVGCLYSDYDEKITMAKDIK